MPPRAKYTKEDLIGAAFEVVRDGGLNCLSARRIAQKLDSSTAPVYASFKTMAELQMEVVKRIGALLLDYTARQYTDEVFLNIGIGMAVFAREERELYRALFMEQGEFKEIINDLMAHFRNDMVKDERLAALSEQERGDLLEQVAVVTHGLASLICVGLCDDDSNESIANTLKGIGASVISAAIERSRNKQ